ncbi:hypothetical protein AgCh_000904 [Apium graveolens]
MYEMKAWELQKRKRGTRACLKSLKLFDLYSRLAVLHSPGMETGGSSAASNSETIGSLEPEVVKRKSDDVGQDKKERIEEVRDDVAISKDSDDVVELDSGGSKPIRSLGPIDQFARAIDLDASLRKTRQQNINDALFKNRTNEVRTYLAKWVYGAGIPFNAINNDDFHRFCEAVGQFGPGYIPPSQHQLREPLLKKEVERTKQSLKEQDDEWKKSGCSIMTDAWSDRKRRSIMNLCVNYKLGTSFLSSIECSNEAHTAKFVHDYVDKYIQEVGPNNVIQMVTDNASNNMAAVKLLRDKRPHIFWTSCATHTLNLMLEAIGKTPKFKFVIDKAKSILEKQEKLKFMFLSEEWGQCKFLTSAKGVASYATIVNQSFWTNLAMCFELFKPLVKVLRLVDEDWRPSMGFVYGELKDAKKEIIKFCKNIKEIYGPIIEIIDSRAKDRLDSPLLLVDYLLNLYYYYRDDEAQKDPACMAAVLTCIEAFFPGDFHVQHLVSNIELLKYKGMEGMFGKKFSQNGQNG